MAGNLTSTASADGDARAAILSALDHMLDSPEFRQSEQSRRMMRYLVEVSLDGAPEQLRERAIGTALFGLEPGYDTAENPIVRVRANELRKRLAKYYQQAGAVGVRFEIPARGYRVEVVRVPPAALPAAEVAPSVRAGARPVRFWWWSGVAFAIVLAVVAVALLRPVPKIKPTEALDQFWGPALDSGAPVLICAGHPVVYRFSREAQERLRGGRVDHFQGQTLEFQFPQDAVLHGRDIVPIPDQYIGLGSAEAVARIHGFLQRKNKEAEIRFGNDLTFTELRKSPAVLIGAFQNRWTVEFMRGFRFIFDTAEDGTPGVKDTQTGKRWVLSGLKENGQTSEDYVLISRVLRGASGGFVIAAGGITQYGGHTVGEVLSDPRLLPGLLQGASSGWASKNLQLLLKVQVIGKTAGPPDLVALHEW